MTDTVETVKADVAVVATVTDKDVDKASSWIGRNPKAALFIGLGVVAAIVAVAVF